MGTIIDVYGGADLPERRWLDAILLAEKLNPCGCPQFSAYTASSAATFRFFCDGGAA